MTRNRLIPALILLGATVPFSAATANPDYNYIEGGYVNADPDNGSSIDGFSLGGSLEFNEDFHVALDYMNVSDSPVKFNLTTLALGYAHGLNRQTDLVGRIGVAREEVRVSGFGSSSDTGLMAEVGIRSMLSDVIELNGFVRHIDTDGSETGISLGGRYFINNTLSLGLNVEFFDDINFYRFGIRHNF